jgi:hypothetical protein
MGYFRDQLIAASLKLLRLWTRPERDPLISAIS